MKVKRIKVHNVKAIIDQEINLNGATVILMGGNNKGKSTLLRALKDRLLKMKADHLVRSGEESGTYIMEFTDGSVISWELTTKTKAGEKLTLTTSDGNKTSAITDIIKWFSPGNFDIDKFLNESPAAQRKTLERLLGLDFTSIDSRLMNATQERKDANRDVERIELAYAGKYVNEALPLNPIPTEKLEKELLGVEAHNARYELMTSEETRLLERKKQLEEELATVNRRLGELDDAIWDPTNAPKSEAEVQAMTEKLRQTKELNTRIEANNRLREAISQLDGLREIAHKKDLAVKDIISEKDAMIRSANMPEGFDFAEEGILYKGLPLTKEQLSSSAIYIAALKLASLNVGNVRMLHFDASFLDKFSLKEVLDWAKEQDMQLMVERPDFEGNGIRYEIIEEDWLDK